MLKPTKEELREAQELNIEGVENMNGPQLRQAILEARRRLSKREAIRLWQKWKAMCEALMGVSLPAGKQAPKLDELRRIFAEELPAALRNRGIVKGARLTIPSTSCPPMRRAGRATVGKLGQMRTDNFSDGHILITLTFDGQRAHPYDAWLVWRHATEIEPPRG